MTPLTALTEARRVLREVQWEGRLIDDGWEKLRTCSSCGEARHRPDCALAAVLTQEGGK